MSDVNPARVVADADVLAADLFVNGDARAALDHVRSHSWVELVASEPLLDDAQAVVAALGDDDLAADWRETVESLVAVSVDHPEGDETALATAYASGAAHVLSYDETLRSARTGMELKERVDVSVKSPDAFARLFDPERLYPVVVGGAYPGPDRDPRA